MFTQPQKLASLSCNQIDSNFISQQLHIATVNYNPYIHTHTAMKYMCTSYGIELWCKISLKHIKWQGKKLHMLECLGSCKIEPWLLKQCTLYADFFI